MLYWTGDVTEGADPEVKAQAFRRHGVLEASIDVILRQEQGGGPDWLRRRRLLRLPAPQRKLVAGLLSAMLRDVFDVTFSPEECRAAFRTMDRVYGTMSDPYAFPTRLLATAAPLIDRSGAVRTQIYPETPSPVAADLFATRRRWYYPSVPDEPRTTTFREIFEEATAETARCLEAISAAAHGDATVERGRGGHRRSQHAHRRGLRRPAAAGRVRPRPGPHLGRRGAGVTAGRPRSVSASS